MTGQHSALYAGQVIHRRLAPCSHAFSYRVFSLLVDLDELDCLHNRFRLFSVNRWNLFSFFERDHGARCNGDLKRNIASLLSDAGIDIEGGSIRLLCYPRVLGYVFNPLSIYYCYRRDGRLAALLYEVTNTFRERHRYLFQIGPEDRVLHRHSCAKSLYVSPFIGMDARYRFAIVAPGDKVVVAIRESDAAGPVLNASFNADRVVMADGTLARFALRYFLMSFKIIGGIYWEAFKLWRKGLRVHSHKPRQTVGLSTVDQTD